MGNSFTTVFEAFASDYWMWAVLYNAVVSIVIAVFFLRDPVGCTMHNKYFHKTIALVFIFGAINRLDRFWNHGLEIMHGGALPPSALIDTELGMALLLSVLAFMAAFDYYKNRTTLSLRKEKHSPCDACVLK